MHNVISASNEEVLEQLRIRYKRAIKEIIPDLEEEYYLLPLEQVRVDSIDLITIRTELEKINEKDIPDHDWISFNSLDEIIGYCAQLKYLKTVDKKTSSETEDDRYDRIIINMPQMAIEALSESWLFKELGHRHWQMLCQGLCTNSHEIADESANRLYATFVRVNINCSLSLAAFNENDSIEVKERMERYGAGIYFSNIDFTSAVCSIQSRLMTSFSMRGSGDNTRLMKSQPLTTENNIPVVEDIPDFANEYRNIKKGALDKIIVGSEVFTISDEVVYETEYCINPYHDLNGVGLLYFAAYPVITDICEAEYCNARNEDGLRWEMKWATQGRDIFYYGNCNPDDKIIYKLHAIEFLEDRVKTYSSLFRKKDGFRIAKVFTIKSLRV